MSPLFRRITLGVVAMAFVNASPWLGSSGLAQTIAQKAIQPFEAASIKPHDANNPASTMKFSLNGNVSISGMTLRNLLFVIEDIRDYQLAGGPKWFDSEQYDISAKAPEGKLQARSEINQLAKTRLIMLLEARCMLKIRRQPRITSIYTLSVLKTGLKMRPITGNETTQVKGSVLPWSMFVADLSRRVDRPLIDKTGLQGNVYEVYLKYTSDEGRPAGMGTGRLDINDSQADHGPSLFTALQEQLGLKLDSEKGPVDMFVIDSVTRPSGN